MRAALAALLAVVALASPAVAGAAKPPGNSKYLERYLRSEDGTRLHADVLRPKGIGPKVETPVILTVSPYTNHSGQTTDYDPETSGPSNRFYDFLDKTKIIGRGYTYVMVDLPGFGGSAGCNDWGGEREQGAVKAAVEWSASRSWSTGKVGMLGKSYDAWTGLMGIAQQPKGLAAVVSMEPVYSGYRYLYMDGVRFSNSALTPSLFTVIDAKPGTPQDDPAYNLNSPPDPSCYPLNIAQQQDDDPNSDFWAKRDLLRSTKGADTPLFMTQGFLEGNTKPDGAFDFFNQQAGAKRAWFGQFDHVRGWERSKEGRLKVGHKGFADEVVRFFDRHVKGIDVPNDPAVEVQDALGRYRVERSWPPPDSTGHTSELLAGTYMDDAVNEGTGSGGGHGLWTFSQPLPYDAWLAGEPVVQADVTAAPHANLAANVYDVAPDGEATMISRGTTLLRGAGDQSPRITLYGQDWPLKAGHRLGVLLSGSNSDWWVHVPTGTPVSVNEASVRLPFLGFERNEFIEGRATVKLNRYRASAPFTVSEETIAAGEHHFDLPGKLRAP